MANPVTADDLIPLITALPLAERVRLLRLLASRPGSEAAGAYDAQPPGPDEFSADYDPLSWDADGWEAVG
jgi:hypothetical protein